MNKSLLCFALLLVLLAPSLSLGVVVGQTSSTIRRVPTDYPTIQAGINAAVSGDTVLVDSGTYFENVVVNKTVSLIGQNKATTIIDGNGIGKVVTITASYVNLTGFTIRRSGQQLRESGIFLDFRSVNSKVRDNIVVDNYHGIYLEASTGTVISFNNVSRSTGRGIYLVSSSGNMVSSNLVSRNDQDYGIELFDSTSNIILANAISQGCWGGVYLKESFNNTIKENSVSNSSETGVYSDRSSRNILCRNNFFYNGLNELGQQFSFDSSNAWDNGAEGNYWNDYVGADLDGDGIGDTGTLPHLQVDSKPLIEPWSLLRVFNVDGKVVTVSSDSTIARFPSSIGSQPEINFNATGAPGALSYCNVTIPKNLLSASSSKIWTVVVDGVYYSRTIAENLTHTSLYFTFSHSVRKIKIQVVDLPVNIPPTADFTYSPADPTVYDTVDFNDTSIDEDGTITKWKWEFGDGTNSTAQQPGHKYAVAGVYTVTLNVTDNGGATTLTSKSVSVRKIGTIMTIDAPLEVNQSELFTITANLQDEAQNSLPNATIWFYMLQDKWSAISHDETNASGIVSVEYGAELQQGTYVFKAVFNGTQVYAESSSTFQVVTKGSDRAPSSTSQLDELLLRVGLASLVIGLSIALILLWRRRRGSESLRDAKKGSL